MGKKVGGGMRREWGFEDNAKEEGSGAGRGVSVRGLTG